MPILGTGQLFGLSGFVPTSGGFENAEAAALVARMTTEPDSARKEIIDTLVGALKTAGVWSKLDALYLFAAHDEQAAGLNWIQDLYNITTPGGDPTFIADQGFATNGVDSYLQTTFNPTTAVTPNYVRNSASFGLWSLTSGQTVSVAGAHTGGSDGHVTIAPRTATNVANARITQNGSTNYNANTDGRGFYAANRSGASATQFYKNGAAHGTGTAASVAVGNETIKFGVTSSVFVAHEFSAGFIGRSLTATEHGDLYDAIAAYLTAIGDEHFANVAVLIGGRGADASTAFLDDGPLLRGVTANGNVQMDTGNLLLNQTSILFDGTGDYLVVADAASLEFGSSDFTIEAFVEYSVVDSGETGDVIASKWQTGGANTRAWFFKRDDAGAGSTLQFLWSTTGTGTSGTASQSWTPTTGNVYHLAVVRNGGDLHLFVDGVLLGTTAISGSIHSNASNLWIGAISASGFEGWHDGWMQDFRITVGVARYTTSFTPPTKRFPRF